MLIKSVNCLFSFFVHDDAWQFRHVTRLSYPMADIGLLPVKVCHTLQRGYCKSLREHKTLGSLLQKKRSATSGLHAVRVHVSRPLGQLGVALASVGMPLVLPPHSMMLVQLMLYCTRQLHTFLPVQVSNTVITHS